MRARHTTALAYFWKGKLFVMHAITTDEKSSKAFDWEILPNILPPDSISISSKSVLVVLIQFSCDLQMKQVKKSHLVEEAEQTLTVDVFHTKAFLSA